MCRLLITFVLICFTSTYSQNVNIPKTTKIDYTAQFWIESKLAITDSFLIKVFLPPDYFKSDTTHFPILFVTDADAFWGAATDYPWFLHWQNPKIIVVGITYGAWTEGWGPNWKRKIDFNYVPNQEGIIGARKFISFFQEELIPEVETRYRIDKSNRTLFGWSYGGAFAFYTLFNQPQLFHNYLILGDAPTPDDPLDILEKSYFEKNRKLHAKVFMGMGNYDTSYPHLMTFVKRLENRRYEGLQFKWETVSNFTHSYEAAVALMAKGLQYIFYKPNIYLKILQLVDEHGVDKAIETYGQLKKTSSEEYAFSESGLNDAGYYLLNRGNSEAAIKIFELNIKEYPKSANTYDSIADAYMKICNKELTIKYANKTLEILSKYPQPDSVMIKNWALDKLRKAQEIVDKK